MLTNFERDIIKKAAMGKYAKDLVANNSPVARAINNPELISSLPFDDAVEAGALGTWGRPVLRAANNVFEPMSRGVNTLMNTVGDFAHTYLPKNPLRIGGHRLDDLAYNLSTAAAADTLGPLHKAIDPELFSTESGPYDQDKLYKTIVNAVSAPQQYSTLKDYEEALSKGVGSMKNKSSWADRAEAQLKSTQKELSDSLLKTDNLENLYGKYRTPVLAGSSALLGAALLAKMYQARKRPAGFLARIFG